MLLQGPDADGIIDGASRDAAAEVPLQAASGEGRRVVGVVIGWLSRNCILRPPGHTVNRRRTGARGGRGVCGCTKTATERAGRQAGLGGADGRPDAWLEVCQSPQTSCCSQSISSLLRPGTTADARCRPSRGGAIAAHARCG